MTIMITGGLGFLGSNLAHRALELGEKTVILDDFSRVGAKDNLQWLKSAGDFSLEQADVRSQAQVEKAVQSHMPHAIFHVAGQVAMTKSIQNPRHDFEVNAQGTLNVLEAARLHSPESAIFFSSTNKVYGDFSQFAFEESEKRYTVPSHPDGFDEKVPLEFHSPYGCSKGAADQYVLDYHRIYGMDTAVFRHSSIYGGRQFSTIDQGWVGWFISEALGVKQGKSGRIQIHGNGKQVRDLLFSSDAVELYFSALRQIKKVSGQAFNIGGGMANSLSILELFDFLEQKLGTTLPYECLPCRESDQKVFVANIGKIAQATGWEPKVGKNEGISRMLEWCQALH